MTDLEDALKRLDKLTQEEARMALRSPRITNDIHDDVKIMTVKWMTSAINCKAWITKSKLSLTVREPSQASHSFILTPIPSDGEETRVATTEAN